LAPVPGPVAAAVPLRREPRQHLQSTRAPHHSSRGAVTRQGAALAASPQGLTAGPAQNPVPSAGVDAVHPADISAAVAVSASSPAGATRMTADTSSLAGVGETVHLPQKSALHA
jgi:hypothetical protein